MWPRLAALLADDDGYLAGMLLDGHFVRYGRVPVPAGKSGGPSIVAVPADSVVAALPGNVVVRFADGMTVTSHPPDGPGSSSVQLLGDGSALCRRYPPGVGKALLLPPGGDRWMPVPTPPGLDPFDAALDANGDLLLSGLVEPRRPALAGADGELLLFSTWKPDVPWFFRGYYRELDDSGLLINHLAARGGRVVGWADIGWGEEICLVHLIEPSRERWVPHAIDNVQAAGMFWSGDTPNVVTSTGDVIRYDERRGRWKRHRTTSDRTVRAVTQAGDKAVLTVEDGDDLRLLLTDGTTSTPLDPVLPSGAKLLVVG